MYLSEEITVHGLAFQVPFIGDGTSILAAILDEIAQHDKATLYARTLFILQSSGFGKSRLVDELSKSHIIFPFCLWDDWKFRSRKYWASKKGCSTLFSRTQLIVILLAYPPRDDDITSYLTKTRWLHAALSLSELRRRRKALFTAFFRSLFETATSCLDLWFRDHTTKGEYQAMALSFYNVLHQDKGRDLFCRAVVTQGSNFH